MSASPTSPTHPTPFTATVLAAPVLDPRLAQVLEYWLGSEQPSNASALARQSLWFTKSEATDEEIRKRFGALLLEALAGRLQAQHPLGWLAQLIVLDQFTRNAYRGTAKAFAGDAQALALAQQGIDAGWDQHPSIPLVARIFIYLPLEHAEDATLQTHSVLAFEDLLAQAEQLGSAQEQQSVQQFLSGTLDYARRHQEVIEQFGRFPHRNSVLGRSSTAQELQYLSQPGAGF